MAISALGVLAAMVATVAIAGQSIFVRLGTVENSSADALVVVLCCNLLALIPATLVFGTWHLTVSAVAPFLIAGLVGTMGGRALYYESVRRIGASRSEPVKAAQPLHATVFAVILLGEVVGAAKLAGIVVIVVGLFVVTREHHGNSVNSVPARAFLLPLGAAALYGLEPTFAKYGLEAGASILAALTLKTTSAAVGFIGYLWWRDQFPTGETFRGAGTRWLVAAGISNTIFICGYYGALSLAPVTFVVPFVQTSPLIVVGLSMAFLSDLEHTTWRLAAGAVTVVVGAITVTVVS